MINDATTNIDDDGASHASSIFDSSTDTDSNDDSFLIDLLFDDSNNKNEITHMDYN
jgi:hypothetical protein